MGSIHKLMRADIRFSRPVRYWVPLLICGIVITGLGVWVESISTIFLGLLTFAVLVVRVIQFDRRKKELISQLLVAEATVLDRKRETTVYKIISVDPVTLFIDVILYGFHLLKSLIMASYKYTLCLRFEAINADETIEQIELQAYVSKDVYDQLFMGKTVTVFYVLAQPSFAIIEGEEQFRRFQST